MNTFLSRANTIFAFTLSVMAALTFGCFLTTAFNDHLAPVTMNTAKLIVKNVPDYSASREKNDLGFITFDLQADLNSIFNWNVKLLFVYLTAEYQTKSNEVNQVVLWDKIIKRGENAVLDYRSMNTKYYFWDDGNGLKGNKNVTLSLSWNVIPNAGTLPKIKGDGRHVFAFPEEYQSSKF
ncbi:signal peptidase complex subunit 3-like [Lingula anatina]|uniref:Signal peptidase complex subunit 3 n=1 Tax=Lingula anatina TaxID=7574 RepID=A0A1S3J272_LINAN|nr:signal peptidase complex subunit 3 [Lingula anatina]XP_013404343.1 signal peptidase complex subunit 3-like [Lingula anatina]|eukprot:XP_013394466.1 signal peptidase complex subunit 3 [Lingula anatina]